jgi:hypothetical protein
MRQSRRMADSDLETAVEASLAENLATGVTQYTIRGRSVTRDPAKETADFNILMKLRGLQSSKRGFNVAQIERPQ